MPDKLDQFYFTINSILDRIKPKNILYIGKIFGEYFIGNRMNKIVEYNIKSYIISEPLLINSEQQKIESFKRRYSSHNIEYLSFDDFTQLDFSNFEMYDIIIIDTVHYYNYINYIISQFNKLKPNIPILFHDTNPPKKLCFELRQVNCSWCGETCLSFFNLLQNNRDKVFNIDDHYVGYGVVKTGDLNLDYMSNDIKPLHENLISITHDDFITNILNDLYISN